MKLEYKRMVVRAVLGLILLAVCAPVIMAQSFTFFDVPNASFIQTYGINNQGEVPGYFFDSQSHTGRSFIWDRNMVWSGVSLLP